MKGRDLNKLLKNKDTYLLMCGIDSDSKKRLQKKRLLSVFHPYICDWLIYTDECLPLDYEKEDFSIPQIKELALMAKSKIQWPELKDFSVNYLRERRLFETRGYTFYQKTFDDFSFKELELIRKLKDMKKPTVFLEQLSVKYDTDLVFWGIKKGYPVELMIDNNFIFNLDFNFNLKENLLLFEKLNKSGLLVEAINELPLSIDLTTYMKCLDKTIKTGTSWLLDQNVNPLSLLELLKIIHTINNFDESFLKEVKPNSCKITALIKGLSCYLEIPELVDYIDVLKSVSEFYYLEFIKTLKSFKEDAIFLIKSLDKRMVNSNRNAKGIYDSSDSEKVLNEIHFVKRLKENGISEKGIGNLLKYSVEENVFFTLYDNGIDITLPQFEYLQKTCLKNTALDLIYQLNTGLITKSELEYNYNLHKYLKFKKAGAPDALLKQLKLADRSVSFKFKKDEDIIDVFNQYGSIRIFKGINLR